MILVWSLVDARRVKSLEEYQRSGDDWSIAMSQDLLGNVLRGYTSLVNLSGVSGAVDNVLATAANLANSASFSVAGVGSGAFDAASVSTTQARPPRG